MILNKIHSMWILIIAILLTINFTYSTITFEKDIGGDLKNKDDVIFDNPVAVLYHNNYLYVSDTDDSIVYKIDVDEEDIKKEIHTNEGDDYELIKPWGLFGLNDTVYISGMESNVIFTYERSPSLKVYENLLKAPVDLYIVGNTLYVLSYEKSRFYVYIDGKFNRTIGQEGPYDVMFDNPLGFDINPVNSKIYVADTGNDRIEVVYTNGSMDRYMGIGKGDILLKGPSDVFYYNGYVFVADTKNDRIVVFDKKGNPMETYGCQDCPYPEDYDPEEDDTNWTFDEPKGIYVYNDKIYVADTGNSRVVILNFTADYGISGDKEKYIEEVKYKYENTLQPYLGLADNLSIDYDESYKTVYNNAILLEEEGDLTEAYNEYLQLDLKMNETLDAIMTEADKKLGFKKTDAEIDIEGLSEYMDTSNLTEKLNLCEIELEDDNYIHAYDCLNELDDDIQNAKAPGDENKDEEETISKEELSELEGKLESINGRINNMSIVSAGCGYEIDISAYNEKLSTAQAYFDAEDYENARSLLDELDNETTSALKHTQSMCDDVNYVLSTIKEINSMLNQSKDKDPEYYDEMQVEIERVRDILYDDPVSAKQTIDNIKDYVSSKTGEGEAGTNEMPEKINIPLIATIIIIITIIAAIFLLGKKMRIGIKKKGL